MELWDIFGLAKRGELAALTAQLDAGFDVNEACEYNGTTALLAACEGDQLAAVELLLARGAKPNMVHSDGYNCYDSTRSRAVRETLLRAGFALVLEGPETGRGLHVRRVLAPKPLSRVWKTALPGQTVHLEYWLCDFPPPSGAVTLELGGVGTTMSPAAGEHRVLALPPGTADLKVTLTDFRGELRFRLFDSDVIASNQGPREFWLPPWGESWRGSVR